MCKAQAAPSPCLISYSSVSVNPWRTAPAKLHPRPHHAASRAVAAFSGTVRVRTSTHGVSPYPVVIHSNRSREIIVETRSQSTNVATTDFTVQTTNVATNTSRGSLTDLDALQTVLSRFSHTLTETDAVTSGVLRILVFGGRNGTALSDNSVWAFDYERQLEAAPNDDGEVEYDPTRHPGTSIACPVTRARARALICSPRLSPASCGGSVDATEHIAACSQPQVRPRCCSDRAHGRQQR